MSFNFNGMMRGLGQGLVNYGTIMKENQKMQWETDQARLKNEREEHLEDLRWKREQEAAAENRDWQSKEKAADRTQQAEQFGMSYDLDKAKTEASIAASQASAANDAERIRLQREAVNKESPEGQVKALEEKISLVEQSKAIPEEMKPAIINGMLGVKNEKGINIPGEVYNSAIKSADERIAAMQSDEDVKKEVETRAKAAGIPASEAWEHQRSIYIENDLQGYVDQSVEGRSKGMLNTPKKTTGFEPDKDIPQLLALRDSKDPQDQALYTKALVVFKQQDPENYYKFMEQNSKEQQTNYNGPKLSDKYTNPSDSRTNFQKQKDAKKNAPKRSQYPSGPKGDAEYTAAFNAWDNARKGL